MCFIIRAVCFAEKEVRGTDTDKVNGENSLVNRTDNNFVVAGSSPVATAIDSKTDSSLTSMFTDNVDRKSTLNISFGIKDDVIPGLDLPSSIHPVVSEKPKALTWDEIVGLPASSSITNTADLPTVVTKEQPSISVTSVKDEDELEDDDEDSLGPLEMAIIKQKDLRLVGLPTFGKSHVEDIVKPSLSQQYSPLPDEVALITGSGSERSGSLPWPPLLDQDANINGASVTLPAAEPMFSDSEDEQTGTDAVTSVSFNVFEDEYCAILTCIHASIFLPALVN